MKFQNLVISLLLVLPTTALAQDKDDELKADNTERIQTSSDNANPSASANLEKQNPEAAEQIRSLIKGHVAHANAKDIDAYLADFLQERIHAPHLLREYTERAMALKDLKIEVTAIEFAEIQPKGATVHTRQISSYTNDKGEHVVDDVILSYRVQKNNENAWKILFTERRRLSAQ